MPINMNAIPPIFAITFLSTRVEIILPKKIAMTDNRVNAVIVPIRTIRAL